MFSVGLDTVYICHSKHGCGTLTQCRVASQWTVEGCKSSLLKHELSVKIFVTHQGYLVTFQTTS